ncbi:MAG: STAS domain-containing protein [Anaerolineales bacterium]|nr:STAS domain-containing protein [Anaerolineales bacterium]
MTQLATFSTTSYKRADLIEIVGRIDSSNAGELETLFNNLLDDGRKNLVVDASALNYLSSAGLRSFVSTLRECNKKGGDLRLVTPSDRVQEVLSMAGLTSLFKVYDDQTSAVGSF